MNPTTHQQVTIDDMDAAMTHCIQFLKKTGMSDEYIAYHINQHVRKAEMYAEDIERGAMHLNTGFETWVNN